jgi:hypothetical protein
MIKEQLIGRTITKYYKMSTNRLESYGIVNICDKTDGVYIGCWYDEKIKNVNHIGLIFKKGNDIYFTHYINKNISFEKIDLEERQIYYVFNEIKHIDTAAYLDTMISVCQRIQRDFISNKLVYNFHYDGDFFTKINGVYTLEHTKMITCVSYILCLLKTFMFGKTDYLKYDDWDAENLEDKWINKYLDSINIEKNVENVKEYRKYLRRIPPLDVFTTTFLDKPLPYLRTDVVKKISDYTLSLVSQEPVNLDCL